MSAIPVKVDPSILGEYENHKYDNTPTKNDWHYVTISQVDDNTLKWTNRADVSLKLTTTSDKTILDTGSDSPYFARGQKQVTVVWEGDRVTGLSPAWDLGQYEKVQEHPTHFNPSEVFDELVAGNQRYKAGKMNHPHTGQSDREELATEQFPKACILGCADSRVPPEIIFDQGLGDLFVVRVAGNFADDDNQASLEYAVQHFHPHPALIVVLGHQSCGAIKAAVDTFDQDKTKSEEGNDVKEHETPSEKLVALVTRLKPAIDSTKPASPPTTDEGKKVRIDAAVRQNVKDNVAILQANEEIKKSGAFVIGARYDLDSGEIEWLTPKPNGSTEGD